VICPSGRFVEPIEKIGFYVHGLFDENFCGGGRSMRGFNPSGVARVTGSAKQSIARAVIASEAKQSIAPQ